MPMFNAGAKIYVCTSFVNADVIVLHTYKISHDAGGGLTKVVGTSAKPITRPTHSTNTMHTFAASAAQQKEFNRLLAKACITGCVPFNFMENEQLQAAAKVVGVKLPSRKTLAGPLLDSIFEEVQLGTVASMANMPYIDASSDGWRKKHCEQGAGLMNFVALGLEGALFWDAINCSALRKDATGIADILNEQANLMTDGKPERLAGFLLDNTKANWAAMKILQEEHPEWIMRGCIAHGLSLAMKDLTTFTRGMKRSSLKMQPSPQIASMICFALCMCKLFRVVCFFICFCVCMKCTVNVLLCANNGTLCHV